MKSDDSAEGTTQAPFQLAAAEEQANHTEQDEGVAASGVFDLILESISKSTGSDSSEFTNDTALADLGVDSIMAIEVVSTVKNNAGVDLPAQFVFEYPTIGDLRQAFGAAPTSHKTSETIFSSTTSDEESSTPDSLDAEPVTVSKPYSSTSLSSSIVSIEKDTANTEVNQTEKPEPREVQLQDNDASPQPTVRLTLLQGRAGQGKTPLYMMADGTGSIATYIHLPTFKSKTPVYGVDSPFLHCPSRLTNQVGIQGVARLVVAALIKALPTGSFYIGGFSAGCMVAFEVCRQLGAAGRKVDGLVLIDLCCPRPTSLDERAILEESKTGVDIFKAAVAADGLWSTTDNTQAHLHAYFLAMRQYNPPPMTDQERPARMVVIWAEKGLINRVSSNAQVMQMLAGAGIATKAYPRYMEDAKLSPMACLVPDKTEKDLGPNGWERYAGGEVLALSVEATHLDLPMPGTVHLLHQRMEKAFEYFRGVG